MYTKIIYSEKIILCKKTCLWVSWKITKFLIHIPNAYSFIINIIRKSKSKSKQKNHITVHSIRIQSFRLSHSWNNLYYIIIQRHSWKSPFYNITIWFLKESSFSFLFPALMDCIFAIVWLGDVVNRGVDRDYTLFAFKKNTLIMHSFSINML